IFHPLAEGSGRTLARAGGGFGAVSPPGEPLRTGEIDPGEMLREQLLGEGDLLLARAGHTFLFGEVAAEVPNGASLRIDVGRCDEGRLQTVSDADGKEVG